MRLFHLCPPFSIFAKSRSNHKMLNPDFAIFHDNAFAAARRLLAGLAPPEPLGEISLAIGEPQLPPPDFVRDILSDHSWRWQSYPKANGTPAFREAVLGYIKRRFGAPAAARLDPDRHILPVPGTREPLHMLGWLKRGTKQNPAALVTNPYYHAWRTGGLASGGEIIFLNALEETGYLPDLGQLDDNVLARAVIVYLCAPTNPQGSLASRDWLEQALQLARAHDFLLVMDECYIDIWRGEQPLGLLKVAAELDRPGEEPLANLVVINSLSKRSNAAGLRAGFICGDARIIEAYQLLAANGLALVPEPLLAAATALYADDAHNQAVRKHYDRSFALAAAALGCDSPKGGFFLWLKVGDDQAFVRDLYVQTGVRVLPGSFMGAHYGGVNPAAGYVRVALVSEHGQIAAALDRLAPFWQQTRDRLG